MEYTYKDKNILNLIDTPGHVDFRTKFLDLLRLAKGHFWLWMLRKVYKHKQFRIYGARKRLGNYSSFE
jgi:peptide subunit release factor RF-3